MYFQVFITILSTFICFFQISLLYFFTSKSEQFWSFSYIFIFLLIFSKVLGFCQNLFTISTAFLLIFSSLLSSRIKLSKPQSKSSSSVSLLVPKILIKLSTSSLSSVAWKLTLSSYMCAYSLPDLFWHFFLASGLALEGLILIFCFFFLCLTCSYSSLSDSNNDSDFSACSLIIRLSTFSKSLLFSLGSGKTFEFWIITCSWVKALAKQ